jgi:hypothetical protein
MTKIAIDSIYGRSYDRFISFKHPSWERPGGRAAGQVAGTEWSEFDLRPSARISPRAAAMARLKRVSGSVDGCERNTHSTALTIMWSV